MSYKENINLSFLMQTGMAVYPQSTMATPITIQDCTIYNRIGRKYSKQITLENACRVFATNERNITAMSKHRRRQIIIFGESPIKNALLIFSYT